MVVAAHAAPDTRCAACGAMAHGMRTRARGVLGVRGRLNKAISLSKGSSVEVGATLAHLILARGAEAPLQQIWGSVDCPLCPDMCEMCHVQTLSAGRTQCGAHRVRTQPPLVFSGLNVLKLPLVALLPVQ